MFGQIISDMENRHTLIRNEYRIKYLDNGLRVLFIIVSKEQNRCNNIHAKNNEEINDNKLNQRRSQPDFDNIKPISFVDLVNDEN